MGTHDPCHYYMENLNLVGHRNFPFTSTRTLTQTGSSISPPKCSTLWSSSINMGRYEHNALLTSHGRTSSSSYAHEGTAKGATTPYPYRSMSGMCSSSWALPKSPDFFPRPPRLKQLIFQPHLHQLENDVKGDSVGHDCSSHPRAQSVYSCSAQKSFLITPTARYHQQHPSDIGARSCDILTHTQHIHCHGFQRNIPFYWGQRWLPPF